MKLARKRRRLGARAGIPRLVQMDWASGEYIAGPGARVGPEWVVRWVERDGWELDMGHIISLGASWSLDLV